MSPVSPLEYVSALAVFSKPVRFAEWKVLQVNSPTPPKYVVADDWVPFGEHGKTGGAWKEIEGERWIYVFRRPHGKTDRPEWVDELHVESDGEKGSASYEVSAVPMSPVPPGTHADKIRPRAQRKPVDLPDNPRFARRILGEPQDHFFFATRIQLHPESILELQSGVATWVTPILFEGDAGVLASEADDVILPVVDPLTILVHLHGYYQRALKEYSDYVVPGDDATDAETKHVARRTSKVLLARTMLDYLDRARNPWLQKADDATYSDLVKQLKTGSTQPLETLLRAYDAQLAYRMRWLDDLNRYLANWFRSGPVMFLGKAHILHLEDADVFLVPWLNSLEDAMHWRETRKLLGELVADDAQSRFPIFYKYVLPEHHKEGTAQKAVMKSASFAAKALKEVIPAWVVWHHVGLALKDPIIRKKFDDLVRRVNLGFPSAEFEVIEVKAPPGYVPPSSAQGAESAWVAVRRGSGHPGKAELDAYPTLKNESKGKSVKKRGEQLDKLLKWINLALTVAHVHDDYKEAKDLRHRAVVVSAAVAKVADVIGIYVKESGRETFSKGISGVTALVEMLGAASSLYDDLKKDKGHMAVAGDSLVLLGAGLQSAAYWSQVAKALAEKTAAAAATDESVAAAEMLAGRFVAVPIAASLLVVGSILVMAGYILKALLTTTDIADFAERCAWGEDSDTDSKKHPWFSRVPYAEWKGRYDLQLEAFVNLLASPRIEGEPFEAFADVNYLSARPAYASIGWLPNEASMDVIYVEDADSSHPFTTSGELDVPTSHSVSKNKQIAAELVSPGKYKLYPTNVPQGRAKPQKVNYRVLWTLKIEGVEIVVPASMDARADAWTKTYPPKLPV